MSKVASNKPGRGGASSDSEEVRARIDRGLLAKLDAWIAEQPQPRPSRSEAIARILEQALESVGAGSIPVEDLNASNDE